MKIPFWLLVVLLGAIIVSMILKWRIDPYMGVCAIILLILMALYQLQEEIESIKEEEKHQRKFVLDRFAVLSEKIRDLANQLEKKMVVDFAEFAKSNPPEKLPEAFRFKKKKRKKERHSLDFAREPLAQNHPAPEIPVSSPESTISPPPDSKPETKV